MDFVPWGLCTMMEGRADGDSAPSAPRSSCMDDAEEDGVDTVGLDGAEE